VSECACRCGRRPTGRSRYHEDHRDVAKVVRRLLRNARRNAERHDVPCALTWNDVLPIVLERWPRAGKVRLEVRRRDLSKGLDADNVRLIERGELREPSLRSALARCAAGARALGLGVDDLIALWRRQKGRCALTGMALEPTRGSWDAASVVVGRDGTGKPALVARAAQVVAGQWGVDVLAELSSAMADRRRGCVRRG
jgi:hypothetical protein